MRVLFVILLVLSFMISSFTISHAGSFTSSSEGCLLSDGTLDNQINHSQNDSDHHCFHCHFFTYNLTSNQIIIYANNAELPFFITNQYFPDYHSNNLYRPPIV